MGTRRLRAVCGKEAGRIGPGERSATGADGHHFDRGGRKRNRIAEFDVTSPWCDARLAFIGQRDVGRGATHVEPDRIGKSRTGRRL